MYRKKTTYCPTSADTRGSEVFFVFFLKGRCIGEIIRLLSATLLYAIKHHIPGLLLMVDFENAFDSVDRSFIEKKNSECI